MASILELNASSDSEDDCDYVPPKDAESELSDGEIKGTDSETELGEPSKHKKFKLDNQCESSNPEREKNADDVWKIFSNLVDSPVPCKKENEKEVVSPSEISFLGKKIENVNENDKVMPVNEALTEITCNPKLEESSVIVKEHQRKPGGLSSLLGTISSKGKKMTILEKSLNDWKTFKHEKGIEKDLETFNKGRQGFLERQRFLERSDLRSYETEKNIRLGRKK